MKQLLALLLLFPLILVSPGECSPGQPNGLVSAPSPTTSTTSGILSHLDANAEVLTLISTESFDVEISNMILLLGKIASETSPELAAGTIAENAVVSLRNSGALSLTGFGRSVLHEGDGVFRQKTFWRFGREARLMDLIATDPRSVQETFLPDSAVYAMASSADPRALWDIIWTLLRAYPDAIKELAAFLNMVRTEAGIDIEEIIASLNPGVFVAVTLDSQHKIPISDNSVVGIPMPGLLIGLRPETDALYDCLTSFLSMAELISETETIGNNASGVRYRIPGNAGAPVVLQPTVRYLRNEKTLLLATSPAIADAAMAAANGAGRLVDSPMFRDCAKGLPKNGCLQWVSPQLVYELRSILASFPVQLGELQPFLSYLSQIPLPWLVSRTTRTVDGIRTVTRTTVVTPASGRILGEVLGGGVGLAAIGVAGGVSFPAVSGAIESSNSTKIASQGRNIATSIMTENMQREANNDGTIWPGDAYTLYDDQGNKVKDVTETTYTTSSDYFSDLVKYAVVPSLSSFAPFSGAGVPQPKNEEDLTNGGDKYNVWSCISVQGGSVSGDAPFLFTRNLKITDSDIRRVLRPNSVVDLPERWNDKLDPAEKPFGKERVVIVTRGGAVQQVRAQDLTAERFFGDARFSRPDAVHILPAH